MSARRGLGQHFILDLNLTRRIAKAAGDLAGRTVIEVGPGPGGLTRALLESNAIQVVAIERDRRCINALDHLVQAYPDRFRLVEANALKQPIKELGSPPRQVIANLPYNIATQLLLDWLEMAHAIEMMTLMFQTEVAHRLVASPGQKSYGRLSVLTQWLCEVRLVFDVSARAFTPPPKVSSSVVQLVPRERPLFPARKPLLERVTQAAFGQRRKMLRSSLRPLGNVDTLIQLAGVSPTQRAEDLSVEDYCRLAEALFTATRANA